MHRHCCRVPSQPWHKWECRCIVPKAAYTVKKCSWGWANLSPETCWADLKRLLNEKVVASCWFFASLYVLSCTQPTNHLTNQPTNQTKNGLDHNSSWEANSSLANQQIHRILWNIWYTVTSDTPSHLIHRQIWYTVTSDTPSHLIHRNIEIRFRVARTASLNSGSLRTDVCSKGPIFDFFLMFCIFF